MTLPITQVSLSAIQTEFGGASPVSMGEYYRGGSYVPIEQTDGGYGLIPTAGPIQVSKFRNQTKVFVLNVSFSTGSYFNNVNVRTYAINAGWNQTVPLFAYFTMNVNSYIGSNSTAAYAFDTDLSYPTGSFISLTINSGCWITGRGGDGGNGADSVTSATAGGVGGPALWARYPITITNGGIIGGGGGGGGGGALQTTGGGKAGPTVYFCGGGGGGGAGYFGSSGGSGGSNGNYVGAAGNPGAINIAGTGGSGGTDGVTTGFSGGNAGGPGAAGAAGGGGGGAGGGAGAAVVGNANITWNAVGTRYGSIT